MRKHTFQIFIFFVSLHVIGIRGWQVPYAKMRQRRDKTRPQYRVRNFDQ
jgi:hypothetical protein